MYRCYAQDKASIFGLLVLFILVSRQIGRLVHGRPVVSHVTEVEKEILRRPVVVVALPTGTPTTDSAYGDLQPPLEGVVQAAGRRKPLQHRWGQVLRDQQGPKLLAEQVPLAMHVVRPAPMTVALPQYFLCSQRTFCLYDKRGRETEKKLNDEQASCYRVYTTKRVGI